jgi:ATP-dependent DNA helicase PIF1
MLVKNMDQSNGLVNGSRGIIVGFTKDSQKFPIVRFYNGNELTIKLEIWTFRLNANINLTRKQLPLQLAWAISIHKSQGMTLDCVEISLARVFECGQAYVALSRARSLKNLRVIDFDVNTIKANSVVLKYYQSLKC